MDDIDCRLLERIQNDFPLASRPYQVLAKELGLAEEEVFQRVLALRQKGIIRHLGAVVNSGSLGFVGTLAALRVPPARLEEVAKIINAHPGVTHNYLREGYYNLWFTLICPSAEELKNDLTTLLTRSGVKEYLELPPQKVFKIRVVFNIPSGDKKGAN